MEKIYRVKIKLSKGGFKNTFVPGLVKADNPSSAGEEALKFMQEQYVEDEIGIEVHSCKIVSFKFLI